MATPYDEISADAMKLPLKDRVRLAQQLTASLDDEVETGVEALWFAEAERRLEELRSGKVAGTDSDEAFENARKALQAKHNEIRLWLFRGHLRTTREDPLT